MKNLLIKIKELKAINYSRNSDSFDVVINFNVNNEQNTLTKSFKLNQRAEILSKELVRYIKDDVKDKNKSSLADDFIEGILIVRYNDVEEIEEKVAYFFKKFKDHVNNYKNIQYSEGFLNRYRTPDGFSLKIE